MSTFPFDIWFTVSCHLSVQDICNLQSTCKTLRSFMQERPVWHGALRDTLTIKPMPHLSRDIPFMSSEDMQRTCVRVARMDKTFSRAELSPYIEADFCGHDYTGITLLPGGERFVAVDSFGALNLHCVDSDKPLSSVPGPESSHLACSDYRILPHSSKGVILLHTLCWCKTTSGVPATTMELRVYHVQDAFELLGTITPEKPEEVVYYALNETAHGPALVYLRGSSKREFIVHMCLVDRLASHPADAITVRLRGWVVPSYMHGFMLLYGSIAFFGSDRLIFATSSGIYLYKIPPFEIPSAKSSPIPEIVDVSPTWSTCGAWAMSIPLLSPPTLYGDNKTRARCAIWTGHDVHTLDIPLHGGPCDFIHYSTSRVNTHYTHQTLQSVTHGLGLYRPRSSEAPSAMICMTVENGNECGYTRLGREPDAFRQVNLAWKNAGFCVVDMSVDELSGKIAVLDRELGGTSRKRLRVYNTLN